MTRAEKRAKTIADKRIERAFYATCSGVQINVMDIGKIFAFGHRKIAEGVNDEELKTAIHDAVRSISLN